MNKVSILKYLKRRTMITSILMVILVSCLAISTISIIRYDSFNQNLVEILGKQRMYAQRISKDALVISFLQDTDGKTHSGISNSVNYYREDLISAMKSFDNVFRQVKDGYILEAGKRVHFNNSSREFQRVIKDADKIWTQVKSAIIKIKNGSKDIELINEMAVIIDSEEALLTNSDKIVNLLIKSFKERNIYSIFVAIMLISAILCAIIFILIDFNKFIIVPFNQLFKGMSEIGLAKFKVKRLNAKGSMVTPIVTEITGIFEKLNHLIMLIENINNNDSFMDILHYMHSSFSTFIPYAYIGIALIEDEGKTIRATYGVPGPTIKGLPNDLLHYRTDITKTSLGEIIETGKVRIINDLEAYTSQNPAKEYNKVLLRCGIKASITLPLKVNGKPVGVIFFSSDKKNVYNIQHVNFLKTLVNSIAIGFNKNILLNEVIYSSILALAKLAESRDSDTGQHLQRMKAYSVTIARLLANDSIYKDQISVEFIEGIEKFSPLHDIGKVAIRDDILLKPGKLTAEEFEIMKTHAKYGSQVLKEADYHIKKHYKSLFNIGIEITECHHEKWDGSGYPYGKSGVDIPLSARIVALADVFDALTSSRPYKPAYSFEESYNIILQSNGTHFDPEIVNVFFKHKDKIYKVYNLFVSNTAAS